MDLRFGYSIFLSAGRVALEYWPLGFLHNRAVNALAI